MTAVVGADLELDRDRGLVEQHQAGDHAAFTQLYALHYGRLVRFCRRLTGDAHAAEEVAQEAFARAFASMDRLQGERRFYPWLTVIARRLVIDQARQRERLVPHAEVEAGVARPAEDVAVQRIDGDHVVLAVGRLSERHREVLRLRDWEGLSYEAIAFHLGVPETTIPPLLHRARAALRREYLGVTRGRVASWIHLAPLFAAARRTRDRVAVWSAHLPDPSVFAAPMAGALLGAAVLMAPQLQENPAAVNVQLAGMSSGGLHIPDESAGHQDNSEASQPQTAEARLRPGEEYPLNPAYKLRDAGVRPEETILRRVMKSDPNTYEARHERTRRMPIYYQEQQTGTYIGVDPSKVAPFVKRTLGR